MAARLKKMPRRRQRKTYVPQIARLPNPRTPYASKYGDELFIKVQKVEELKVLDNNVFSYMRVTQAQSSPFNPTLLD